MKNKKENKMDLNSGVLWIVLIISFFVGFIASQFQNLLGSFFAMIILGMLFFVSMLEEDQPILLNIKYIMVGLISSYFIIIIGNFEEALPFINGFVPILSLVLGILFLTELLFWTNKETPRKNENTFNFTIKKKFKALIKSLFIYICVAEVLVIIRELVENINYEILMEILKWIGYIGAGIICLGIILLIGYGWIKLNELKYKKR
jgi:hypothetical protein